MHKIPAIVTALRNATSDLHREVGQLIPFFEKGFDQEQFARWLCLMHPFYKELDDQFQLQDFLKLIGWEYNPRSALIERDLSLLETNLPVLSDSGRSLFQNIDTTYKRLGSLYVVEGSALGGQILLNALSPSIPMVYQHGSAFLSPYGDATSERWTQFIECLGAFNYDEHSSTEIIHGASITFAKMSAWIKTRW